MNVRRAFAVSCMTSAGLLCCLAAHAAGLSPTAKDMPAPVSAGVQVAASGTTLTTEALAKPKPHVRHRPKPAAAADAVPDFSLAEVSDGKTFHLRDHLGEVVLIDFWATWCGPCRMAIPHLIDLQKKYHKRGFTVVGISLDQQGSDVVRTFAQNWSMNYPVVVDGDGSVARDYGGVRAIPTTVVIDGTGRVVGDPLIGYRPLEEYEALIKKALKAT